MGPAALVLLAIAGCGNGLASVSGLVTLDGEPVTAGDDVRATVFFNPIGGGATAVGLLDNAGRYRLSTGGNTGVVPGDYNVTFTATRLIRSPGGGTPSGQRVSPTRYATPGTSGLRFTVDPGGNTIDLTLTSDG